MHWVRAWQSRIVLRHILAMANDTPIPDRGTVIYKALWHAIIEQALSPAPIFPRMRSARNSVPAAPSFARRWSASPRRRLVENCAATAVPRSRPDGFQHLRFIMPI